MTILHRDLCLGKLCIFLVLIREVNLAKESSAPSERKQCDKTTVYHYLNKHVVTAPDIRISSDGAEIYILPASIFEADVFRMRPVPSLSKKSAFNQSERVYRTRKFAEWPLDMYPSVGHSMALHSVLKVIGKLFRPFLSAHLVRCAF